MKKEILDKSEAHLPSQSLKRAAFVLALLLSAWFIFLIVFTLQVLTTPDVPPYKNAVFERPFKWTMSGVMAWYLICTIAAWRIYFSKLSAPVFRNRLRWVIVFAVLPFILLLLMYILILIDSEGAFF